MHHVAISCWAEEGVQHMAEAAPVAVLSTFVGRPARSACARAGVMTVSSCSGWHVSQAYTLRAFMSHVLTFDPHRPHVE